MKNTAIGNLECVTIISSEVRTNAGDPARAGNAAMNKAEAVNVNEPTADSKEDSASGNDDHYQRVLEKIDLSGFTHEQNNKSEKC